MTPLRRSSRCTLLHCGGGSRLEFVLGIGYSRWSNAASSSDSGSGQVSPCSFARTRDSLTVDGDAFRLREIARMPIPASWCRRRTSRILRIDTLLCAIAVPSRKGREDHTHGRLSRVVQLRCSDPSHRSGAYPKSDRHGTGISDRLRLEWVIGFDRNTQGIADIDAIDGLRGRFVSLSATSLYLYDRQRSAVLAAA